MIELLFVACMASGAERCEEHSLLFQDMPLQVCTLRAQVVLADWAGQHPDWRIEEWRCLVAGSRPESV